MNLQQYFPLAIRTAKIMERPDMIAHGGMGCGTEAGELADTVCRIVARLAKRTDVNIAEELGDAAWFGIYICFAVGVDVAPIDSVLEGVQHVPPLGGTFDVEMMLGTLRLCAAAELVGTPAKAHRFSGKELDVDQMAKALDQYFFRLAQLCDLFGLNFGKVLEQNIEKLAKRYPDKYSDANAIARADKIETLQSLHEKTEDNNG